MQRSAFVNLVGVTLRNAVVNIVVIANALVWYFYTFDYLSAVISTRFSFPNSEVAVFGVNFLAVAATALLSPFIIYRIKRRVTFILYWMLAGCILSLMLFGINITSFQTLIVFSILIGVYFGLGMPTCLGYFAASTEAGNRARLGGLTFLFIFLGLFLSFAIGIENIMLNAIILAFIKSAGLLMLLFLKPDEKQIDQDERLSYNSIFTSRPFLLVFIPWLMFSIVNYTAIPMVNKIGSVLKDTWGPLVSLSPIIENATAGLFAVVFGFFADFIGRKRLVLAGFSLLGLGYAVLGMGTTPPNIYAWWFYTITDGVAWGAFFTIFIMTIWGDLAYGQSSEKYYAIGSLPYLFSIFMRFFPKFTSDLPSNLVFSFASFFLFIAVLPLIYAPETLPEKKIKERELKGYLEKAKRKAERHSLNKPR